MVVDCLTIVPTANPGALGLPQDLGDYTQPVLKVQGAYKGFNINGYYTKLPALYNGKVCFSKMLGPDILLGNSYDICADTCIYVENDSNFKHNYWLTAASHPRLLPARFAVCLVCK